MLQAVAVHADAHMHVQWIQDFTTHSISLRGQQHCKSKSYCDDVDAGVRYRLPVNVQSAAATYAPGLL
jgi:hypothetical protein